MIVKENEEFRDVVASYVYKHNNGQQSWNDTVKFYDNGDGTYKREHTDGFYTNKKRSQMVTSLEMETELESIRNSPYKYPTVREGYLIEKDILKENPHQKDEKNSIVHSEAMAFENQYIHVGVTYNNDENYQRYEHIFDSESEAKKFVNGEEAKDKYGKSHILGDNDIVEYASVIADIDLDSLKKSKQKDRNDYDTTEPYKLKENDLVLLKDRSVRMVRYNSFCDKTKLGIFSYNSNDNKFYCTTYVGNYDAHLNDIKSNFFHVERVVSPSNKEYKYFYEMMEKDEHIPKEKMEEDIFDWSRKHIEKEQEKEIEM